MSRSAWMYTTFGIGFFVVMLGGIAKLQHWSWANDALLAGFLITLAYVVLCLVEIYNDRRNNLAVKLAWTAGFFALPTLVGFIYLVMRRRLLR